VHTTYSRKLSDENCVMRLQLDSATDQLRHDLAQTAEFYFLPGT